MAAACWQGVLLEDGEKLDSLSLLYWMSSISCCMLLPAALLMEREAFHAVPTLAKQHACEPCCQLEALPDEAVLGLGS